VNAGMLLLVFVFLAVTAAPVLPGGVEERALLLGGGLALLVANIGTARLGSNSKLRRGPRPNTASDVLV